MERIGPYEVLRPLGEGGMGTVVLVRRPGSERLLALKLLPRAERSETAGPRFLREAEALARVRHPGVVRVHDAGEATQGSYLVMDYVEGPTLAEAAPLPPPRAAAVVAEVADAVQALHAAGLLHRDVKPENVVLRSDGRPVLLDFGLVRPEDAERLTRTGQLVGTPYAMSPEQVEGRKDLGPAVDVWGLGVVLCVLLGGEPPFQGEGLVDLVLAVRHREPRLPSAPTPLLAVARRCLRKDPAERYPSAAALAADLRRAVRAGARSGLRRGAAAGGLVALAAAGVVVGAVVSAGPSPQTRTRPEASAPGGGRRAGGPVEADAEGRGGSPPRLAEARAAPGSEERRRVVAWLRAHLDRPHARELHAELVRRDGGLGPRRREGRLPEANPMRPACVGERLFLTGRRVYPWPDGPARGAGDGAVLAVAGDGEGLWVESVFFGRAGGELRVHGSGAASQSLDALRRVPVRALAASEALLAAGDANGKVWVFAWDRLRRGEDVPSVVLSAARSAIAALAFAPDGRRLLAASGEDVTLNPNRPPPDNRLVLWDLADPTQPRRAFEQRLRGEGGCLAVSPDGRWGAVSTYWVNEAFVFSLDPPGPLRFLEGDMRGLAVVQTPGVVADARPAHALPIQGLCFLPTGLLVSAGGNSAGGELRVWDPVRGEELARLTDLPRPLFGPALVGSRLWCVAAGSQGGRLLSWPALPEAE